MILVCRASFVVCRLLVLARCYLFCYVCFVVWYLPHVVLRYDVILGCCLLPAVACFLFFDVCLFLFVCSLFVVRCLFSVACFSLVIVSWL